VNGDDGRAPVGRVGAAAQIVAAVLAALGVVVAAVDEVLADGSNRTDWAVVALGAFLLVLAVVSRRLSQRG
jgi:hypothetical protein